jgi:hypothetical protein
VSDSKTSGAAVEGLDKTAGYLPYWTALLRGLGNQAALPDFVGNSISARAIWRDQSFNETLAAPKLNIVPVNQTAGLLDCLCIVGANQRFESNEMPIVTNGVSPILCHPKVP